jgi:hypothetical protein
LTVDGEQYGQRSDRVSKDARPIWYEPDEEAHRAAARKVFDELIAKDQEELEGRYGPPAEREAFWKRLGEALGPIDTCHR